MSSRSSSTSRERRAAALAVGIGASLAAGGAGADPPKDAPPAEITVRAAPRRRDPGRTAVDVKDARRVPGTQGDALKVLESLPGVGRSSFGNGRLVVWGAAPADTRVYVDGVEIPALYHESGLRGTINGDLIQRIDLAPGAWGAEYGRALGGLVRVQTRDLPREGVHGYAGADLLDASALVTAAAFGRIRAALAARVSYVDRILAGAISPSIADYVPLPRYRDYQAKVTVDLREDEELSAVLLGSGDSIRRVVASPDPAEDRAESTDSAFHRVYLRYTRALPGGDTVAITPFAGQDDRVVTSSSGAAPASQSIHAFRYGVRAARRVSFGDAFALNGGVDLLGTRADLARVGSLRIPPREGDEHVFGQPPGPDVNADSWSANLVDVGPFLIAELRFGPLTLTPGLRFDTFLIEGSRLAPPSGGAPPVGFSRLVTGLDPRLAASWALDRRVTLSASGGVYHQPPAPEDLGAVFGTPALSLSRALHVAGGLATRLPLGFTLDVTGYYEGLSQLVVRSRLPAPRLAQALVQDGEGRSYGLSLQLRAAPWPGFLGWIAWSAGRSERRYVGDAGYRLFDQDQTHLLTAVASQQYRGFELGLRVRYASGAPRTPVAGAYYDTTAGAFQPIFGAINSERLPDFVSLDVRAEVFSLGETSLRLSLDVLNATNRQNAEELAYSFDFSRRRYVTGLPTLAVLGLRVER